ncbi:MAG: DMT family transporter [Rhodospirillales bacterium]
MVALFTGAAAIAFAPIFVRLSEVGPIATGFYRLALALPVLWAWDRAMRRERRDGGSDATAADAMAGSGAGSGSDANLIWGVVLAGLCFAGDLALWHWSLRFTSVANATLFPNLAPVFVTLIGWLLWRQRVRPLFLIGMAMAIAGAALLMGGSVRLSQAHLLGDALALVTAVFYAGYIVAVARLRQRLSTSAIMVKSGVVTAVVLFVLAAATGERLLPTTTGGWATLVGLALLSHAAGQSLIAYALAHLPATFSAVGLLLQPAIAALLAWLLFAEAIGGWQAAGAAVILAGIVVARRGSMAVASERATA